MSRVRTAALLSTPLLAVLSVPFLATVLAGPASAGVSSVSGSAYGESVTITAPAAITSGPAPSVTLPSTGGGPLTASLVSIAVPAGPSPALTAGLLEVSTQGALGSNGSATSSASVATVAIPSALTATAVSSTCTSDTSGSTGSASIVSGTIGGQPVVASPPANTVIQIPSVGEVRLNEQIPGGDGTTASSITVNAVHVVFNNAQTLTGDIILAQSHCDVAGPATAVPVGAIGGLGLTAILGAGFVTWTLIHRRRSALA